MQFEYVRELAERFIRNSADAYGDPVKVRSAALDLIALVREMITTIPALEGSGEDNE